MARKIQDLTRPTSPSAEPIEYPEGRVQNETAPGAGDGTGLDEKLFGDQVQAIAKEARDYGFVFNGNADNESNGFDLLKLKALRELYLGIGFGKAGFTTSGTLIVKPSGEVSQPAQVRTDAYDGPLLYGITASTNGINLVQSFFGLNDLIAPTPDNQIFSSIHLFGPDRYSASATDGQGNYVVVFPDVNTQGSPAKGAYNRAGGGNSLRRDNWIASNIDTGEVWHDVIWFKSASLFIAVGLNNAVATSPDGITWTNRTGAVGGASWTELAISPDGNSVIAVGPTNDGDIMTSPDGINWTSRSAAVTITTGVATWASVVLDVANAQLVFISGNGQSTSADGVTWTAPTSIPQIGDSCAIGYGDGMLVRYISLDATVWGTGAEFGNASEKRFAYSLDGGATWRELRNSIADGTSQHKNTFDDDQSEDVFKITYIPRGYFGDDPHGYFYVGGQIGYFLRWY